MAVKQRKGRSKGSKRSKAVKDTLEAVDTPSKDKREAKTKNQLGGDDGSRSDQRWAFLLFAMASIAYLSNLAVYPSADSYANVYMPLQVFRGTLSFHPENNPAMFMWKNKTSGKRISLASTFDGVILGTANTTAKEIMKKGELQFMKSKYGRQYVNTFNIGAGITFVPIAAILALFYGFDLYALQANSWLLVFAGKTFASALVAASASFMYLSARTFSSVSRTQAMIVAAAYAFGTCVWSVSSQALWQHGPNEFYLSVAIWTLLKAEQRHAHGKGWSVPLGALCGFSVAMATITRPTSVVMAAAIGAYFVLGKRSIKMSVAYGGVGAVLGAFQLYYNYYHYGNPFEFGQQQVSRGIAQEKTGSPDLWQTPLLMGASTLLFSPSRGLFIYSPFTVFAVPGLYFVWLSNFAGAKPMKSWFDTETGPSRNEFEALRPLCVSLLILWSAAFKFFDYWGGWCFGYRPLVDTMPMLMMFLCVTINRVQKNRNLWYLFLVALAWSVMVQYVGANCAARHGWNSREGMVFRPKDKPVEWAITPEQTDVLLRRYPSAPSKKEILDPDRPDFRSRLWSVTDSQILWYLNHYEEALKEKHGIINRWIKYC